MKRSVKKRKKVFLIIVTVFMLLLGIGSLVLKLYKINDIDVILESKAYSYLPIEAK